MREIAPLLEMRGISKSFPGVKALDKVNLEVRAGEVLALLGENGAGKSTLLKILSGAYQKDEGEIFLDGQKVEILMFRSLLKPIYTKMIQTFKEANPNVTAILHCDGAVKPLLNDFKDIGFDVFNPVQPGVPGHGPQELKDYIGDRICFWGAIDQQYLLPRGTDEEVEKDIREKCEILGKDGGHMIAPAHIIQADVTPERVEFFIEMAKKYGQY